MEGHVGGEQYVLGFVSFFTISLGGFGIGIVCGLLTALITRTTSEVRGTLIYTYVSMLIVFVKNFPSPFVIQSFKFLVIWIVVEPLAVLGMAYFSYMCAELFHFSGIIR